MDAYIGQFCSVLRAGLWNQVPEIEDLSVEDMRHMWEDARKQAVSGLVAQAFLNTKRLGPKTSEMLQNKLMSIAAMNFKLSHILADSVKALREAGIEPILLKGHGVASYYHQPLLRECGDIDLYVGTEQYRKAFDVLSETLTDIEDKEFEAAEKHSHIVVKGIPIELHQFSDVLPGRYNPDYQKISDESLSGSFGTVSVDGIEVETPEPTFNAFFVFNHFWRHFIAVGVGFRQVCDWVVLLHSCKDVIDRQRLKGMLCKMDLIRPWKVFGYLAVNSLGLPVEEMPFYDGSFCKIADKVVAMMMKEGNFGHEREDRWSQSGHPLLDRVKDFIIITWRYVRMLPSFGRLAMNEYFWRIFLIFDKPNR